MKVVTTTNSTAEESISRSHDYWGDVHLFFATPRDHYEIFYFDPATIPDKHGQIEINLRNMEYQQSTQDIADELEEISINATSIIPSDIRIDSMVHSLFNSAVDTISDEVEQVEFANELARLIHLHGKSALGVISDILYKEKLNPELAWITLQELGRLDSAVTHKYRLWILIEGLQAASHWYRDGSALGLSLQKDPSVVHYLMEAERKEVHEELRESYLDIINQLENLP